MMPTIERYGSKAVIYNKQTEHYDTHIDNDHPSKKYEKYKVPAGYTVYVRVAKVYFEV
jgi:hypothetical protein